MVKITSIAENTSLSELPAEHGLSLHIQIGNGPTILFDTGQGGLFASNAESLGLNLADVDIAVLSHGHYDHGGGLGTFLSLNRKAKVFVHRNAFQAHYSLRESGLTYIGIDPSLQNESRICPCTDRENIIDGISLFAGVSGKFLKPLGNRLLFGPSRTDPDDFSHEQNLLIRDGANLILVAGCAHCGILNIMAKVVEITGESPTHVFAGMHLVKSGLSEPQEAEFIGILAASLKEYSSTMFYTMHCTGTEQYRMLKSLMGKQIDYLSCGESVVVQTRVTHP